MYRSRREAGGDPAILQSNYLVFSPAVCEWLRSRQDVETCQAAEASASARGMTVSVGERAVNACLHLCDPRFTDGSVSHTGIHSSSTVIERHSSYRRVER